MLPPRLGTRNKPSIQTTIPWCSILSSSHVRVPRSKSRPLLELRQSKNTIWWWSFGARMQRPILHRMPIQSTKSTDVDERCRGCGTMSFRMHAVWSPKVQFGYGDVFGATKLFVIPILRQAICMQLDRWRRILRKEIRYLGRASAASSNSHEHIRSSY